MSEGSPTSCSCSRSSSSVLPRLLLRNSGRPLSSESVRRISWPKASRFNRPSHCIPRRSRQAVSCQGRSIPKHWLTSRDCPNPSYARSIVIPWDMGNGNIFGDQQAVSWESEAKALRSHSGSATFPLLSGISRDAPPIMIGCFNIQAPHPL